MQCIRKVFKPGSGISLQRYVVGGVLFILAWHFFTKKREAVKEAERETLRELLVWLLSSSLLPHFHSGFAIHSGRTCHCLVL